MKKVVKQRPNPLTRPSAKLIQELGLSFSVVANRKYAHGAGATTRAAGRVGVCPVCTPEMMFS